VGTEDLYTELLGIPEGPRPPNHYTLLGLALFESNREKIHAAMLHQTTALRKWSLDPNAQRAKRVQAMLNEVSRAGAILEAGDSRDKYNLVLSREMGIVLPGKNEAFAVQNESVLGMSAICPRCGSVIERTGAICLRCRQGIRADAKPVPVPRRSRWPWLPRVRIPLSVGMVIVLIVLGLGVLGYMGVRGVYSRIGGESGGTDAQGPVEQSGKQSAATGTGVSSTGTSEPAPMVRPRGLAGCLDVFDGSKVEFAEADGAPVQDRVLAEAYMAAIVIVGAESVRNGVKEGMAGLKLDSSQTGKRASVKLHLSSGPAVDDVVQRLRSQDVSVRVDESGARYLPAGGAGQFPRILDASDTAGEPATRLSTREGFLVAVGGNVRVVGLYVPYGANPAGGLVPPWWTSHVAPPSSRKAMEQRSTMLAEALGEYTWRRPAKSDTEAPQVGSATEWFGATGLIARASGCRAPGYLPITADGVRDERLTAVEAFASCLHLFRKWECIELYGAASDALAMPMGSKGPGDPRHTDELLAAGLMWKAALASALLPEALSKVSPAGASQVVGSPKWPGFVWLHAAPLVTIEEVAARLEASATLLPVSGEYQYVDGNWSDPFPSVRRAVNDGNGKTLWLYSIGRGEYPPAGSIYFGVAEGKVCVIGLRLCPDFLLPSRKEGAPSWWTPVASGAQLQQVRQAMLTKAIVAHSWRRPADSPASASALGNWEETVGLIVRAGQPVLPGILPTDNKSTSPAKGNTSGRSSSKPRPSGRP
jgi:hypothetical protein